MLLYNIGDKRDRLPSINMNQEEGLMNKLLDSINLFMDGAQENLKAIFANADQLGMGDDVLLRVIKLAAACST